MNSHISRASRGADPKRTRRIAALTAVAALGAMTFSGVTGADNISNNLDISVDAVAEVMPLNVGGANGTTTLYVVSTNGDGKNGCNLTGSTTLVVSVTSSNASVATVSPASATFTSCGDTKSLTITPLAQGSTTISVSQTSNNTDGTFDFAPATFTVNVAPPSNTAPTITVAGVVGGTSYNKGAVPAATCQVTDAEDGNSTVAATLSAISGPYASDGIGSQTASCSYTDGGGLTAAASETYGIVDPSAPVVGYSLTPVTPNGDNGWYNNGAITLAWVIGELESPNSLQKSDCADQNINNDEIETYSCSATSAGGSSATVTVTIKRDATKPTISATRTPANGAGWNNTAVTVSYECTDNLSGVATCSPDEVLSGEGADQESTGTAEDRAGNAETATVASINIDLTKPTISASSTPANGAGWNNTAVTVSYLCTDSLSGVVTCGPDEVLSGEGANQQSTGTARDAAGNTETATVANINIDQTGPAVSLVGGPVDGASYLFGSVPGAPTCHASDGLSGLAGPCVVSGFLTTVGTHTVEATATDKAGNENSSELTYNVLPWTRSGFYQPVDMGGVVNTVKAGATVPLKFEVFSGNTELTSISAIKSFTTKTVTCGSFAGLTDDVEVTTTGGTTLRYDATGGQFVQNWQSPKTVGVCHVVTMTTQDGQSLSANFKTK